MSSSLSLSDCNCGPRCKCHTAHYAVTRQAQSSAKPWLRALPNILTTARLGLLPVYAWLLWHGEFGAATLVYLAALLTDIDGHIARRWGGESGFGAVFDPVVDGLFMLVALAMLIGLGRVGLIPVTAYVVSVAFRALPSLAHFRETNTPASSIASKAIAFCGFASVVLATIGAPLLLTTLVLSFGAAANIFFTMAWLRRGTFRRA